jgi:prepilin-type N-terminal cleavage/methylation domain-containing protein
MDKGHSTSRKGFTLIELLVVIAIIAILSVVVILTLNPAELLRQSRDSNRISDLSVTKSAIAFYLASVSSPSIGSSTYCYVDASGLANGTSTCTAWFSTYSASTVSTTLASNTLVNGSGWIPINFSGITAGGSPLGSLPKDPTNQGGNYFYSYTASTTGLVFKLDAHMESSKYGVGGSNAVVSTDGGTDANSYEVGTNLTI